MLFRVTATRTFHGESSTNSVQLPTIYIESATKTQACLHIGSFIGPNPEDVTVEISIEEMEWNFSGDYSSDIPVYVKWDFDIKDFSGVYSSDIPMPKSESALLKSESTLYMTWDFKTRDSEEGLDE